MWQFREEMLRQKVYAAIPWYNFNNVHAQEWQWHIHDDHQVSGSKGMWAQAVQAADIVIIQYLHTMEALALFEALRDSFNHIADQRGEPRKIFLTEIDDYVHETPVDFECFESYKPGEKYRVVVEEQIKAFDGVIVSTPYLKEAYSSLNDNIWIVPNAIDFEDWDKIEKVHAKNETRIGWSGGGNHREDLLTIKEPLEKYLTESKDVTLHMVHGMPDDFKDKPKVVWHKHFVSPNKWPKRLTKVGFDIGLCPLQPNDFKKAKSNLRRLEYAALGIPVLARKWGHLEDTVEHGKDGFLYETEQEFAQYLDILVKNKELREDMGRHNYLTAKRDFSLESVTKHYIEVLREAIGRGSQWIEPQPEATLQAR